MTTTLLLRGGKGLQSCLGNPTRHSFKTLVGRKVSTLADSFYNEDQKELQNTVNKIIDTQINPHCDKWEEEKMFPAHDAVSYTHLTLPTKA